MSHRVIHFLTLVSSISLTLTLPPSLPLSPYPLSSSSLVSTPPHLVNEYDGWLPGSSDCKQRSHQFLTVTHLRRG